ncbi:D-alanyl-D-alanine dipeptidase [Nonomuraea sp. SMC257]|uniref:D-alanyl-D-alanine dipeptidase n=1 Tax=Nonomuraea montanisoli TaxID=2741721 RepID=A0A7Y6I8B4_9ACTN|nr:M15 family metallopeptidase [Nonomuraea montanisoli]NUW33401.1 D-alanyl-D-alanine dipeptidase [Nonomuraea montanisoli]
MTAAEFEHVTLRENGDPLTDLTRYPFECHPSYFHRGLSPTNAMFARQAVAELLVDIQRALAPLTFKIWDGYRPRRVQRTIFDDHLATLRTRHPDASEDELRKKAEVFVTDPGSSRRIPPHATGGAVDLTLLDAHGRELDMGTPYDHFGPESAALYFEDNARNPAVRNNRRILRDAMTGAGFRCDADEWWHFDFGNQIWAAHHGAPAACYGEIEDFDPTIWSVVKRSG